LALQNYLYIFSSDGRKPLAASRFGCQSGKSVQKRPIFKANQVPNWLETRAAYELLFDYLLSTERRQ